MKDFQVIRGLRMEDGSIIEFMSPFLAAPPVFSLSASGPLVDVGLYRAFRTEFSEKSRWALSSRIVSVGLSNNAARTHGSGAMNGCNS